MTLLPSQFKDGRPAASANATRVTTLSLPRPAHPRPTAATISRIRCRAKGQGAAGGERKMCPKVDKFQVFQWKVAEAKNWHRFQFFFGYGHEASPNKVRWNSCPVGSFVGVTVLQNDFFRRVRLCASPGCIWGSYCLLSNFNCSFCLQVTSKSTSESNLWTTTKTSMFGRRSLPGTPKSFFFDDIFTQLFVSCHPQGVWDACAILNRWWMHWPGRSFWSHGKNLRSPPKR